MSSPIAFSSGVLSTTGTVKTAQGLLTYAEAIGGIATFYEGSTSGKLLATVPSSHETAFTVPVKFDSLYVNLSAGTCLVHTG